MVHVVSESSFIFVVGSADFHGTKILYLLL